MEANISAEKLKELISAAPKAQLHLHLDGSLSFQFICSALKRLKARKQEMVVFESNWEPSSEKELINWFRNQKKCEQQTGWKVGSRGNWNVFTICNYFLQTEIDLIEATYDLVTRLAKHHNVNYLEIRFAPVLHTNEGLTQKSVVEAVLNGFAKATTDLAKDNITVSGGVILCGLRSFPVSEVRKTVDLINNLNNRNILGFDIAGDERTYPLNLFKDVIKLAVDSKINTTVHAGEWNGKLNPGVIDNLRVAVELGVNRIGHGLALASLDESDEIFKKIREAGVSVEICLTGNCSHPDKCASFLEHPLVGFLQNNIQIAGLNVDNLLLSGNEIVGCPDPSGEFVRAICDCGVTGEQLLGIVESSYRCAFANLQESFVQANLEVWKEKIIPLFKS